MGCGASKKVKKVQEPELERFTALAARTPFTVSEVESLYELYTKVSSSIVDDGVIQKEDFQFALFGNSQTENLFASRIFDLFDVNLTGHIDFDEFVQSLGVFHPKTSQAQKVEYVFKLYDLRHTGFIERKELKEMVLAVLNESDLALSDEVVETIVDKTFTEADAKGDGRIDQEEWKEYVARNPSLLKNMTLPYLMDITLVFPNFVLNAEGGESRL